MMIHPINFDAYRLRVATDLLNTEPINVGEWQSQDISDDPDRHMRELLNESFCITLPQTREDLATQVSPNLPWAEDHFMERVSGEPLNPPPSEQWWPYAQHGNSEHKNGKKFSHTYPERMWPRFAGDYYDPWDNPMRGIRYDYGDLQDVVNLLMKSPNSRQAYLPIWFPEDTGAVHGERVPCTLGYHFLIREKKLQITYYIRSCDFLRHFADDVYMAGRLAQYVAEAVNLNRAILFDDLEPIIPSTLIMHIVNLHSFKADTYRLAQLREELLWKRTQRLINSL